MPFLVSHLVAALMIASWTLPPMNGWWDALDDRVFHMMNGMLASSRDQQVFWAFANHRSVDLVSGSLAGLVVIWWIWGEPRSVQNWRCAVLGALAIPVIILPFVAHGIFEHVFPFERSSPTMVYEGAQRLTKLVPWIVTKDASRYSFPGDHAFVLFSIVLYYWYFGYRAGLLISAVMAGVFMLPRVVGGAHWLTDNIMGGAVPALLVTAWVLATPFSFYVARGLLPVVSLCIGILPSWLRIPDRPRKA